MSCNPVAGDPVLAERDRMRRLFNRLDAAISHHDRDKPEWARGTEDDALYAARDRVLRDYAKGNG